MEGGSCWQLWLHWPLWRNTDQMIMEFVFEFHCCHCDFVCLTHSANSVHWANRMTLTDQSAKSPNPVVDCSTKVRSPWDCFVEFTEFCLQTANNFSQRNFWEQWAGQCAHFLLQLWNQELHAHAATFAIAALSMHEPCCHPTLCAVITAPKGWRWLDPCYWICHHASFNLFALMAS